MRHRTFMAACTLSLLLSATSQAQRGTSGGQWPNHSGDKGSTKYAPLDQINRSNVRNLHVAWRRPAVADELRGQHQQLKFSNLFRSTPLMINGVLYASDGIGLVEAFDPATGRTLWVQESTDLGPEALAGTSTRGIAYWRNGADERILSVRPPYLYAINLKTGELIRSFGEAGKVDLRTSLGPQPQPFNFTSAPLIVKDIAVIGSSIADNPNLKEGTRGDVRGYEIKTGKLRWTFRTIPREREFGVETWEDRSWEYTGAVNAWSNLSADEELGYIYLPLTSPTSDMYGGHRLGNNLFSDSLVCLKAETGERVWHFQLVHHDLWDYDLPAAPILADIRVNGKPIKAVVQVTKQGFAFVFDRVTGQPVWPIEERPVPQSATPGERTAPTQPFPTKPAPFERQGVSVDDLIDFTPELRREAIDITKRYVVGPLFTPPSIKGDGPNDTKGTLQLPGSVGGADWNGAALDPETGILYVPS
ncbi:MAG: pyrroloquinoline quinone-dependent dehydrogenase, partial [Acidobacteria bacterium]